MLTGGILLTSAMAVLVVFLVRLAKGRPSALERWATTGVAVGLLMSGGGILAANLVESIRGSGSDRNDDHSATTQRLASTDSVGDQERQVMSSLHRDAVTVFVGQAGFGRQRMLPPPLEDEIIKPSHSTPSQVAGSSLKPLESSKIAKDANRIPHYSFRENLENRVNRMLGNNEGLKIRNVQLVGLIKHSTPVVYDTKQVPGMKGLTDIPTHELDAFETTALAALQNGDDLKIEKHGKKIRMMGPIFAGKRCVACHEQQGQLLGAFTYALELVPETMWPVP